MKHTIQAGDTGFFYPAGNGIEPGQRAEAEVIHVWSDTCVNLRTAEGFTPTSVLVWPAGREDKAPTGYYFVPHAKQAATSDDAIEQEILAKGLTAPRITPADIEANIASESYFTASDGVCGASAGKPGASILPEYVTAPGLPLTLLTFCVLVLRNGFTVTGESACASPENFDADVGRKIARANAVNKVWPLMGYALRNKLAGG